MPRLSRGDSVCWIAAAKVTFSRVSAALAALALIGCGSSHSQTARTVDVHVGGAGVRAEVAESTTARERGLSGRATLAEDRGMLFVYPDHVQRTFWMKGMRFPIDIVWIDRGRVAGVEPNVPVPVGSDLPLYPSRVPADRVLEVRAGWAARHGVERGDRVSVRSG
jgi:uncharacterized membrane protein (UPF0127 family)